MMHTRNKEVLMKKTGIFIAICLAALACDSVLEPVEVVELGCASLTDVSVGHQAGRHVFDIVSDGEYSARLPEDAGWIRFEDAAESREITQSGDGVLAVEYDSNRNIQREAVITLSRGNRTIELTVVQKGILTETFTVEQKNVFVAAEGGTASAKVLTLTSPGNLKYSVEYVEEEAGGWISNERMENNYLKFDVAENWSDTLVRHAVVTLSVSDGSHSGQVHVTQNSKGTEYTVISFAELKGLLASEGSYEFEDHVRLEGVVLNDNVEGNGAENRNISSIIQDLSAASRTLYLSTENGDSGVRVDFDCDTDALADRFDRVTLDLHGMTLARYESPVRYILTGASSSSMLSSIAGTGASVTKECTIGNLTAEDVYTLRTLPEVEIPIRKGPYIGIDLRQYHLVNKYPMVIRDPEGNDMHMMVNTTCTWHRDGDIMPQGSGSLTGIIVHEHCDQFEWDVKAASEIEMKEGKAIDYINDLGDLGLYQIRPVAKSDIAIREDFTEGFSELLCEYRYCVTDDMDTPLVANATDITIFPTYPGSSKPKVSRRVTGRMTIQAGKNVNDSLVTISRTRDWTLLGPLADGRITDVGRGNGVLDYFQVPMHWDPYEYADETGLLLDKNGSSWCAKNWTTGQYWCIEFSTAERKDNDVVISAIDASHAPMSIQFGTVNDFGTVLGGPRYWVIEYSLDGRSWIHLHDYTVPDFPSLANKRHWQCPGNKYITYTLPESADVWNKETVYIRLRPSSAAAATADTYDKGKLNSKSANSLNYFAIRYNK